jgi:hypothetical protein
VSACSHCEDGGAIRIELMEIGQLVCCSACRRIYRRGKHTHIVIGARSDAHVWDVALTEDEISAIYRGADAATVRSSHYLGTWS